VGTTRSALEFSGLEAVEERAFARRHLKPAVSVVIATHNRPESLQLVLEDLRQQRGSDLFEVIVVDDRSDRPVEFDAWASEMPVSLLRGEGLGPAHARNIGWRRARADLVLFTDDDVRLSGDWVRSACRAFESDAQLVSVEGRVDSKPYDWLFERSVEGDHAGPGLTCNIGYRRAALEELGGFDEALRICEDIDLIQRASKLGPSKFIPEMRVEHTPRGIDVSGHFRNGLLAAYELRLIRKNREHYPAGRPFWYFPVLYHGRNWANIAYRERLRLFVEPRRGVRWLLAATADLAGVAISLMRFAFRGNAVGREAS
jgi:glycosyltransferase involved in cell wall biosynthesis